MPLFTSPISPSHGAVLEASVSAAGEAADGSPAIAVRLLVDTGCSHTSIRPRLARRLGLVPIARRRVSTPSHHGVPADVCRVSLTVGSLVTIRDLAAVGTPLEGQDVDGLLGRDVLRHAMLVDHGPEESWTVAF